jgi:hypothetical protein
LVYGTATDVSGILAQDTANLLGLAAPWIPRGWQGAYWYIYSGVSGYPICLTHHLPKVMLVTFKMQIDTVKGGNPLKISVSWGFKALKRSAGMSPTVASNQNK